MKRGWFSELRGVFFGFAAILSAGVFFGYPLEFLVAGVLGYLSWQIFNLHRLYRWLESPGDGLPRSRGIWASVFEGAYRIKARDSRRRQRLRKVVEDFRQAAAATPDAAVILRDDGEIAWINAASTRLLGLRYPQDLNQLAVNLIRDPEFANYLEGGTYREPLQISSPVDESTRLLIRIVPYSADRRLMLARDVTRLHRLEQMRKDFVANVSHELRSPLTVIVGYLENLTDDESVPAELRRPLQQMAQQANRMCLIVEDLLRLSRIEDQPGAAPRDEIAAAGMLERIHADAVKLSQGKHEIRTEIDRTVHIYGEHNELYSAFSNLVFNAIQYTPEGGEVLIRWARAADGAGALMEVRDTGIGIDPHHLPRLTERFYRIDKARSRDAGGTGLGLAIVKHVLLRHDGSLKIDSVPGEGSKFQCAFPASRIFVREAANVPERA